VLKDCEAWVSDPNRIVCTLDSCFGIDINEFLPPITLDWCHQKLISYGMQPTDIRMGDRDGNGTRLYVNAYYALRSAIHAHMQSGELPILEESAKPYGRI
jgi:hypothetical protein